MDLNFVGNDPAQDDLMVVTNVIVEWVVRKTLIDQRCSSSILNWSIFEKLDISHDLIQPHKKPVTGFAGERVYARKKIDPLTTFGLWKLSQSLTISYVLVNADTSYSVLLGIPTLNKLGTILSTLYLATKFPSSTREIVIVKVDQTDACECYVKSCKIEPYNIVRDNKNNKAPISNINVVVTSLKDLNPRLDSEDRWPTPIEDIVENFQIRTESHECTKIGKQMKDAIRKKVEQVLLSNVNCSLGACPTCLALTLTSFSTSLQFSLMWNL